MKNFDNSIIAHSIYKARALVVGDFLTELLRANSMIKPSYLQEIRLANKQNEYALAPYGFLRKIASHTLLPDVPEEKIDDIVCSDNFNINVTIRSLDNKFGHVKRGASILLSCPKNQDESLMDFPKEGEYIGLPRKLFKKEDFSFLENLIVYVNPQDVLYWRNRLSTMEFERESKSDKDSIEHILDDILRRPGFEPGS